MKKVNFKKRVSQLMAGVFGLALMGVVMLSSQEVDAQWINSNIKEKEEKPKCFHQSDNVEVVN